MKKIICILLMACVLTFPFMKNTIHADTSYGWGYKQENTHELPDVGKYGDVIKGHKAYYADKSGEKTIYLTFDMGYEEGYTPEILDVLKAKKVPATFFVTGHFVDSEPGLVKRMVKEGHIIGNHSVHHKDFTTLTKEEMKSELDGLESAVAELTKQKKMKYLRPPSGTFSEKTLEYADELGYIHVFWSLAFKDWITDDQQGWKYAYDHIMDQIHPGAIILLHAVSADNAHALAKVITNLRKKGYTFKSLDDLVLKDILPGIIYGW